MYIENKKKKNTNQKKMKKSTNIIRVDGKNLEILTSAQAEKQKRNKQIFEEFNKIKSENPNVSDNKISIYLSTKYNMSTVWIYKLVHGSYADKN